MPLTSVVQYLNQRLPELHPHAHLGGQARFLLERGQVTARLGGFRLVPRQVPVLLAATGEVFAWSAKLLAHSAQGRRTIPETLYVQAWDSEDTIFLDRFLRTLHALHHLSLGPERKGLLALDVHLRHVAALPQRHGEVFEGLLHRLGLDPRQIVLRLCGRALHQDPHVREAAASFSRRGYGLLAVRPEVAGTDWELLSSLGVHWVSLDAKSLELRDLAGPAADWARAARARRIGLWLEGASDRWSIVRAARLGVGLIEGAPFDAAAPDRIGPGPLPGPGGLSRLPGRVAEAP